MKAFTVEAEWAPKRGYDVSERETESGRADIGSMVWKNPQFSMVDIPVPEIGDDDLLVRVKKCGICGSDSHLYETDDENYILFSGPVKLPCVIGHEYSGVVEKVGKNVQNFRVGDLVAAESVIWCGKCTPCRSGSFNQCEHVELAGITENGALADFVRVNERQCWSIDALANQYNEDDVFTVGALIEPLGCAYNGIFIGAGGFKPGSTVAVYGAGPIGLGAIALAHIAGASQIITFDTIAKRLEIAQKMGSDHTYIFNQSAASGQTPSEIVMELTNGRGADLQIEAAGAAPATIPEMENSLAVNGKIVYLGRSAIHTPIMLDVLVSGANSIIGIRGHSGYGIYDNIIRLLSSGRLSVSPMVTSELQFSDTEKALKQSVSREDGKIMVKIS